mmetsp:Transcript_2580/g.5538  ORF Transcript_2580/g.5538 Transcript_2580/m.5538 type:complete len:112 (+) Transcript_2580:153-488(+)
MSLPQGIFVLLFALAISPFAKACLSDGEWCSDLWISAAPHWCSDCCHGEYWEEINAYCRKTQQKENWGCNVGGKTCKTYIWDSGEIGCDKCCYGEENWLDITRCAYKPATE